jgi:hypothetical protein
MDFIALFIASWRQFLLVAKNIFIIYYVWTSNKKRERG